MSDATSKASMKTEKFTGKDGDKIISDAQSYFKLSRIRYDILLLLSVVGMISRVIFIDNPHYVVFDEVHFGKFASYYLRGEYYFDVHPPLGKMMFALSGYLANYDGKYLFDHIGEDYLTISDKPVPYTEMRVLPSVLGGLMIPLIYGIVIEVGGGNFAATIAAIMLLLDNAQICQTRLILLDSFLLFFIFVSLYTYLKFRNASHKPFSGTWWLYLFSCGTALACAIGIKMVGLFIILNVGFQTALELWNMYSDTSRPMGNIFKHFFSRALCLILIPSFLTFLIWSAHFLILTQSGPGDSHMSKHFQATLEGNPLSNITKDQPQKVAYGSLISLSSVTHQPSCYLHSHEDKWPVYINKDTSNQRVTSGQQQVTCYPHVDDNNLWYVVKGDRDVLSSDPATITRGNGLEDDPSVEFVKDGDEIQLVHLKTIGLLNSLDVASAVTPNKQEMSVWRPGNSHAPKTKFKISFVKSESEFWVPHRTKIQIHHVDTPTTLQLTEEILPDFAFKQFEVVSAKDTSGLHDTWFVETHENNLLKPEVVRPFEKMGLISKLYELLPKMIESNNQLSAKHVYASRPGDWPIMTRGISFYQGKDEDEMKQIYLLGNFAGWLSAHFIVVLFLLLWSFYKLRVARNFHDLNSHDSQVINRTMNYIFLSWCIHYLPFFFMDRQLFLHHYLPAVIFCYIISGIALEHIVKKFLPSSLRIPFAFMFLLVIAICFLAFAPMSYGFSSMGFEKYLRFRRAWDFKVYDE